MREAVAILDERGVDFEYDGEMSPDVALEPSIRGAVSVLPADRGCQRAGDAGAAFGAYHLARWRQRWAAARTIGPLLIGMEQPVQIVPMDASVSQIVDVACMAAHQAVPRWAAAPVRRARRRHR